LRGDKLSQSDAEKLYARLEAKEISLRHYLEEKLSPDWSKLIGPGVFSCGMGDVLLFTAICKYVPDCTIELPFRIERYARFFRGITEKVIIKSSPDPSSLSVNWNNSISTIFTGLTEEEMRPTLLTRANGTAINSPSESGGAQHRAARRMSTVGLEKLCYFPYVDITREEREKGRELIAGYENPIVFKPNTAGHKVSAYRELNTEDWKPILKKLSEKHTILNFGMSKHMTEFENTISIKDVSVSDLICYYSAINKYVGVDTGDMHLMLACGGSVNVLFPAHCGEYQPAKWNYLQENKPASCGLGDDLCHHPRAGYFKDPNQYMSSLE